MPRANGCSDGGSILQTGRNCWQIGRAARAAVLVDGAAYFGALRKALSAAKRTVFIVGWDIDSRVRLLGPEREDHDSAPAELGEFLSHLVGRRPELQVHLLLWDYSMVYALERQPLPSLNLNWATPRQIKVCLDDVLPLGACHHQKIVVIDDAMAFCGGLDLTIRRWDTSDHRPEHPDRRDPNGEPYEPFHDVHMSVDGKAALLLADLVRQRWSNAACETALAIEAVGDPWPDDLEPDFTDIDVAVARTEPTIDGTPGVREIEALYIAAIEHAERFIYIENQFLTADLVGERLAARLAEVKELEVLAVSPKDHESWLEARTMKAGRIRFMRRFEEAGVADRIRLVYPWVAARNTESPVMVHAKVMIVDDALLRVGSSNLNNRSMGMDTECDLAIEATNEEQSRWVAGVRNRLLSEHLGVSEEKVAEVFEGHGSRLQALAALSDGGRRLRAIRDEAEFDDSVAQTVSELADPERPIESSKYVGDMFGGQPAGRVLGRLGTLFIVGLALLGLALAWRFSPLTNLADPESLRPLVDSLFGSRWAPLLVPAVYVLGGLVAFPVTVLIVVTAMLFEPGWALLYAAAGSVLSALVTYLVGALAGRKVLREVMGRRLNRISRALAKKGVLSVMAIRMVPIAPFTLINLVAGVSHIRFNDYLFGTILGMAPGILVITALGNRLVKMLADPSFGQIALLALILCTWLGLSAGLQFLVSRMRAGRGA